MAGRSKVLDMTRVVHGPGATVRLADDGATVVWNVKKELRDFAEAYDSFKMCLLVSFFFAHRRSRR